MNKRIKKKKVIKMFNETLEKGLKKLETFGKPKIIKKIDRNHYIVKLKEYNDLIFDFHIIWKDKLVVSAEHVNKHSFTLLPDRYAVNYDFLEDKIRIFGSDNWESFSEKIRKNTK